jgi:hypothetical protein
MPYWKLQQKKTVPAVLGFSLSGLSTIAGDYVKTAQTCNGAPVYQCAALGTYLYAGAYNEWGMDYYYWCVNSSIVSQIGQMDDETMQEDWLPLLGRLGLSSMDFDPWMSDYGTDDYMKPTAALLTGTWYRNDGQTGSFNASATTLYSPSLPLLDGDGADEFGVLSRRSLMGLWIADVLCFQRLSSTASFSSIQEAAAAWASAGGSSATRLATSQTEVEDGKAYPDGYQSSECFCRWQGQVFLPTAGNWSVSYQHDDSGFVRFGSAVVGASGSTTSTQTVALAAGWQEIDILVSDTGGNWGSSVKLTPPGGSQTALSSLRKRCHVSMLGGSSLDYSYS